MLIFIGERIRRQFAKEHIQIHLMLIFICTLMMWQAGKKLYSNTSHVNLYQPDQHYCFLLVSIQIHLMLIFISLLYIL